MPITINVTGDSAAEVQQLVADLAGTMSTKNDEETPEDKPKQQRKRQSTSKKKDEPKTEEKSKTEKPGNTTDIPSVVDIRAKAKEITDADTSKRPEVKALLDEFDCKNITSIPEDRRTEFMERLEELA